MSVSVAVSAVAGLILLNRGFGYVGVPLGPVPLLVGELTIAATLLLLPHPKVLPTFVRDPMCLWLGLWFLYGGAIRAAAGLSADLSG